MLCLPMANSITTTSLQPHMLLIQPLFLHQYYNLFFPHLYSLELNEWALVCYIQHELTIQCYLWPSLAIGLELVLRLLD